MIQYDAEQQQFIQLPYGIPVHVTLGDLSCSHLWVARLVSIPLLDFVLSIVFCVTSGGLVRAGSTSAPAVVSILPQVDAIYSRYHFILDDTLHVHLSLDGGLNHLTYHYTIAL